MQVGGMIDGGSPFDYGVYVNFDAKSNISLQTYHECPWNAARRGDILTEDSNAIFAFSLSQQTLDHCAASV
jgi:hypothetical protein